jgi:hypothetical protein
MAIKALACAFGISLILAAPSFANEIDASLEIEPAGAAELDAVRGGMSIKPLQDKIIIRGAKAGVKVAKSAARGQQGRVLLDSDFNEVGGAIVRFGDGITGRIPGAQAGRQTVRPHDFLLNHGHNVP